MCIRAGLDAARLRAELGKSSRAAWSDNASPRSLEGAPSVCTSGWLANVASASSSASSGDQSRCIGQGVGWDVARLMADLGKIPRAAGSDNPSPGSPEGEPTVGISGGLGHVASASSSASSGDQSRCIDQWGGWDVARLRVDTDKCFRARRL